MTCCTEVTTRGDAIEGQRVCLVGYLTGHSARCTGVGPVQCDGIRSYAYIPFDGPPSHALSVSAVLCIRTTQIKEAFDGHLGWCVDRDFRSGLEEGLGFRRPVASKPTGSGLWRI